MIEKNSSDEIIETVHNLDTDTKLITNTEVNLNSISLLEFSEISLGISQSKVPIENHTKIIEEDHLDLTKIPTTPEVQSEKEFLEELDKIILNQFDRISSDETLEENTSIFDLCASTCDLWPDSSPEFKALNQHILNLSPLSSRSSSISLSEEIHETSYFSKAIETSSPLEISNSLDLSDLLVPENLEGKRIASKENMVSRLFIPKNTEDKPISNYTLVVQIPRIINYYRRTIFVDS